MNPEMTRRNFLRGIVLPAAVYLAESLANNIPDSVFAAQEATYNQAPAQGDPLPEKFRKLDKVVYEKPEELFKIAKEISGIGCGIVGRKLDRDGNDISRRQHLLEESEFYRVVNDEDGCAGNERIYESAFGLVLPNSNSAFINLTRIMFPNADTQRNPRAATWSLAVMMHEAIHQVVKNVQLDPPADLRDSEGNIIKAFVRHGVTFVHPLYSASREGRVCFSATGTHIEEAIVEHGNTMFLKGEGFNYDPPVYTEQVAAYHGRIIVPYFDGVYMEQLKLYADTDPDAYFTNIGRRYKASPINRISFPGIEEASDSRIGELVLVRAIPRMNSD